jgi:hypothetical protein
MEEAAYLILVDCESFAPCIEFAIGLSVLLLKGLKAALVLPAIDGDVASVISAGL